MASASSPNGADALYEIDIVIVSYRCMDLLRRCLISIYEQVEPVIAVNVYVIDNDSGDDTAGAIRSEFPDATVVEMPSNRGFAAATNVGIRMSRSDFILVLNPDTELRTGVLSRLAATLNSNGHIGLIGCRLEQKNGDFDHASKRTFPDPAQAFLYLFANRLGIGRQSAYTAPGVDEYGSGQVDAINGAFMLARRADLEEVGLFDESYWMYGEDLDLCKKIEGNGLEVYYDGTISAVHIKGGTTGPLRSHKLNWHFHRSMAIFYRRYNQRIALLNAIVYAAIFLRFSYFSARYQSRQILRTCLAIRGEVKSNV